MRQKRFQTTALGVHVPQIGSLCNRLY